MAQLTSPILLCGILCGLAGCVQPPGAATRPNLGRATPLTAPAAAPDARIAVLLPLTGSAAAVGQGLLKGVQLAMGDNGPQLDVRDTASTPTGATAAAQAAVAARDGVIVGPLTNAETAAVAAVAAGVPVLALTSDRQQARPGVWVLGITPDQQVARLLAAVEAEGKTRVAAVLPDNAFGDALADALNRRASEARLPPPMVRRYPTGRFTALDAALRDVSGFSSRPAGTTPLGLPFDTLLLAVSGNELEGVASVLPAYDIKPGSVRLIGPAQWARDGGSLPGGWFAAPDPAARRAFDAAYAARFAGPAPTFADIGYDAATLARIALADPARLTQPSGFQGVDGPVTLLPNGQVQRGLAVFEVVAGGSPRLVAPAGTAPGS